MRYVDAPIRSVFHASSVSKISSLRDSSTQRVRAPDDRQSFRISGRSHRGRAPGLTSIARGQQLAPHRGTRTAGRSRRARVWTHGRR